jgi:Zn-finger nucleic acid-binding protein
MEIELKLLPCAAPCPGCGGSMTKLSTETGVAAGCRACGGVWIDNTVAMLVVTARLSDGVKAFVRHIAEGATGPAPANYRTAARREERVCPVCQAALVAKPFGERPTTVDVCRQHGTYFDLRELDGVIFDVEMQAIEKEKDDRWVADHSRRPGKEAFEVAMAILGAFADDERTRSRRVWNLD